MKIIPLKSDHFFVPGDDVSAFIIKNLEESGESLEDGDVIVIAQSIVSKAEGNIVDLSEIEPTSRAMEIAEKIDENPRKVQVILEQSKEIVRSNHVLITRTKHGFVCAHSGVDSSNVEKGKVTLLPEDPDASASSIRKNLEERFGKKVSIIISDSWGRPFRLGAVGMAIGISGIEALVDLRGEVDSYDRVLKNTVISPPDSLAAIASLEMGEASEKIPAVLIRGAKYKSGKGSISDLIRSEEEDLFR